MTYACLWMENLWEIDEALSNTTQERRQRRRRKRFLSNSSQISDPFLMLSLSHFHLTFSQNRSKMTKNFLLGTYIHSKMDGGMVHICPPFFRNRRYLYYTWFMRYSTIILWYFLISFPTLISLIFLIFSLGKRYVVRCG